MSSNRSREWPSPPPGRSESRWSSTIKIVNGTVYTPHGPVEMGTLVTRGDRIVRIGKEGRGEASDGEVVDAQGCAVLPGLIDVHTFGCKGAQLSLHGDTVAELSALARNVVQFGVTSFLVSLPMGSLTEILGVARRTAEAIPGLREGARCEGIHLEGPYLDPRQRGAFPREALREPKLEEIRALVEAAGGYLRIVTLAPNLPGSHEAASYLQSRGIVPSLGHTNADYSEAEASLEPRGNFGLVTHIFNAMSGLHHRKPGTAGAALAASVPVMLICDGEHVHPAVVKTVLRAKGRDKVILVTDAIAGAGLPEGQFELFGQPVNVRGGRATLADGTLAGSVLTLNRAIVLAREYGAVSFSEAVQMATVNPAHILGLGSRGTLEGGQEADIAVLDLASGEVRLVLARGEVAYRVGQHA